MTHLYLRKSAGDTALNQTGLSTQIPLITVYLPNSACKQIALANGNEIIFRESNELRIFESAQRQATGAR